jgi:Cu/Ag efflux pump CusA
MILGGLLSSTFLNLVLAPDGYAALHRRRGRWVSPAEDAPPAA